MKICIRITFIILFIFSANGLYAQPTPEAAATKLISTFEKGNLYRSGRINVLDLHGSYYQMGRQYGYLLRGQLKSFYQSAVVDYFQKQKGLSADLMKETAMALYASYPARFKDMIRGMAETSGLPLDAQIMLNALELYGSMSGCSGIIAWGEYTGYQPLIAGRNYDWFDKYLEFAQNLTVTIFHPESGIPNAIITFAGVIYATTGLNADGLFLALNNGRPSGGALSYANRVPAMVSLLAFLNDYSTMDNLDIFFNTTRTDFAFIINTADQSRGISYEWAPFEHRRRSGDADGLLVATNHFVDPSWGIVMKDNVGFETLRRRGNLLALGHNNKGKIDVQKMKEILDTTMKDGGATWPLKGSEPAAAYQTVYQVIAVPEYLQIWVKVPGFQDWTKVELKKIMAK